MIGILVKTAVIATAKKVGWKIALKKIGLFVAKEGGTIAAFEVAKKFRENAPVRHLRKLEKLKAKGIISPAEYSKKRNEILNGMFAG